jgi:hypothetical protein
MVMIEMIDLMNNEYDALDYLQAVYRGLIIAENQRMKAAIASLPFERPKLAVVANVNALDFASELEKAIVRSGKSLTIDGARPALSMRQ